jgi:Holliday junction DNA helicase RuvA
MIGKLKGMIDEVTPQGVLLDVGGVCYNVFCTRSALNQAQAGAPMTLFIETMVREDFIHLYGFISAEERAWFNLLLTVQGVGMKVAMALLSAASPEALAQAIALQQPSVLTQADGVGPKLATRILNELKGKAPALSLTLSSLPSGGAAPVLGAVNAEALSALVNLGYKPGDVIPVLKDLDPDQSLPLEQIIPNALARLTSDKRAA